MARAVLWIAIAVPIPEPSSRAGPILWISIAVLLAFLVLAFLVWEGGDERRALMKLPPEERQEVFRREFADLQELCGRGPREDAMKDRCRSHAEFVLEFLECDAACADLANSHLAHATR